STSTSTSVSSTSTSSSTSISTSTSTSTSSTSSTSTLPYVYCVGGSNGNGPVSNVYYLNSQYGLWSSTTSYPISIFAPSCVYDSYNGYVYCIGGYSGSGATNAVYYSKPSLTGGLGAWQQTTSYPLAIDEASCVLVPYSAAGLGGYDEIVCIGGGTNAIYAAPVLPGGGLGSWSTSNFNGSAVINYPFSVSESSCFSYVKENSSASWIYYIFCVGGFNNNAGSTTNLVYSTKDSGWGFSKWQPQPNYPVAIDSESCDGLGACVGGGASNAYFISMNTLNPNNVYITGWSPTNNVPIGGESCAVIDYGGYDYIYCVGGGTNKAYESYIGAGLSWQSVLDYPSSIYYAGCFSTSPYDYTNG
ncbi:MAG: hypothetical protein ACP5RP_04070, partial [Candidatus Micrarchaeia archaeon]